MTLKLRRWLKALAIAKILFEEEGYHTRFLEEIEAFVQEEEEDKEVRDDGSPSRS